MAIFTVSFKYSETTYCSNVAIADSAEAVKAYYNKYEEVYVSDGTQADVDEAEKKGKPIVKISAGTCKDCKYIEACGSDDREEACKGYEPAEPGTLPTFKRLEAAYVADQARRADDTASYIEHGYCKSWSPVEIDRVKADPEAQDRGIRRYSTERRWDQYMAGQISREEAVNYAIKRYNKQLEKETAAGIDKIRRAYNVEPLKYGRASVVWSNYGNCSAESWGADYNTGHAGGWGYDKESAALAEAFNKDLKYLRILYALKEAGLAAGQNDDSATACTGHDNRSIIGYGAGYSVIPHYEGGVGAECFWSIFKKAGIKTTSYYGKRENGYTFEAV